MGKLKEFGKKFIEAADYGEMMKRSFIEGSKCETEHEAIWAGFKEGAKYGILSSFMPITTTMITLARAKKHEDEEIEEIADMMRSIEITGA